MSAFDSYFGVFVVLCLALLTISSAFNAGGSGKGGRGGLSMNFFGNLFGPKATATARHILMDQKDVGKMNDLKKQIEGSKDVTVAFGQAASKFSKCPSSQKAGSLGEFSQGMMVPAFDKVVFDDNTQIGAVQGPVQTNFGVHLILVEDRNKP